MQTIFENYELFIKENQDELNTPQDVLRMVNDEGMFRAYTEALTSGLDSQTIPSINKVLNRQREMIVMESANVPASSFATGWTVMSFPILADIYAEPIIAELCNVFPASKSIISVPRVRIKATTKSYDGTTTTTQYIPTAKNLVRAGEENLNIAPNTSTNIITTLGLSAATMKLNRRFTLLRLVNLTETDASMATHDYEVTVNLRPDNRNQLVGEFEFVDSGATTVKGQITGHVNFDSSVINFQIHYGAGTAGSTYATNYGTYIFRFNPVGTMNGRTQVDIETTMDDLTIDKNEDFLINLSEEQMQDFASIYKIDMVQTLSEAIKRQMLLNKDYELSFFLEASETDLSANGTNISIDLDDFSGSVGDFQPTTPVDVMKSVIPYISSIMSQIHLNFNMYPSYLVTGLKTASLLRSLQDMVLQIPGQRGNMGFVGGASQFLKLKILESGSISDNKMFMSTKAPVNNLKKSTIVDFVYRPMYVIKEITDGNTRNYIRSRTMIEVLRTDGLGLLKVNNIDKYVGNVG